MPVLSLRLLTLLFSQICIDGYFLHPFVARSYLLLLPLKFSTAGDFVFWNTDETWYDLVAVLESECSDEDFHSVFDDVLSLNGSEVASRPSIELRSQSDEPSNETKHVYLNEMSSSIDENAGMDNRLFDCGMIPSNCLPCLANTVPLVEKRRSSKKKDFT
ncbi:hypothetical protein L1987_20453 [Smallanthus sonchifolius]|uniref:Uncharacterized protein n=1 Tax=Smallanthus sonchifolius TaxID=185202 RepID=A0ACB9ISL9_9ASTR|nr:hypothetical protein L1987_20453 [Smallanthus sonchifolius]